MSKYRKVKRHIRAKIRYAEEISVEKVARRFNVDPETVHKACKRFIMPSHMPRGRWGSQRLQRLVNTPGVDYYPIGNYGRYYRFPHADGAKNPFPDRLLRERNR